MSKIYFLSESFFSKYYQSTFGWKYLKKKGFNIKVINTAKLTYNKYFKSFKGKIFKNKEIILDKHNFEDVFNLIKEEDHLLSLLKPNDFNAQIFAFLESKRKNYSIIDTNPAIIPPRDIILNLKKLIINPLTTFKNLKQRIYSSSIKINPKFIFFTGSNLLKKWKKYKNTSKLIHIPSPDYDKYLKEKRKRKFKTLKKNYAVFINAGFHHPDIQFFRNSLLIKKKPSFSQYYSPVKDFLKNFELKTGMKIIIASHPKLDFKSKEYGNFEHVKGKTMELVKDCSLCLTFNSTAISFAVLFKKPILFLSNNFFIPPIKTSIENVAKYFGKTPLLTNNKTINLQRIRKEMKINSKKYIKYRKEYLSMNNSNKTSYEILSGQL